MTIRYIKRHLLVTILSRNLKKILHDITVKSVLYNVEEKGLSHDYWYVIAEQ